MTGDWISASEARAVLSHGWKDQGSPTDAIFRRATYGLVRAKAARWITIENFQRYEKFDEPVPRDFWADESMQQDWSHGDFRSVIYPDDIKFEITAFGVTFERSGIVAMVVDRVASAPPVDASASGTRRGRPKGSGGFAAQDAILVDKMREYIAGNPNSSIHFAAGQFAAQAAGSPDFERKQRRLADRYRKTLRS